MANDNIDLRQDSWIISYLKGAQLLELEEYDHSIEKFKEVLSNDPANAEVHSMLALSLAGGGRFEAAEQEAKIALGLAPEDAVSFLTLGIIYSETEKFNEAEEMFQKAAGINPQGSLVLLAEVKVSKGDYVGAERTCIKALELEPANPLALGILAVACHYQKRYDEAHKLYIEALKDDPENPGLQNNLGSIYLIKNQPDKALVHFRAALRINPGLEATKDNIINALKAKNRFYGFFWRCGLLFGRLPIWAKIAAIIGGLYGILYVAWYINSYIKFINNAELGILVVIILILFGICRWLASQIFISLVESGRIK